MRFRERRWETGAFTIGRNDVFLLIFDMDVDCGQVGAGVSTCDLFSRVSSSSVRFFSSPKPCTFYKRNNAIQPISTRKADEARGHRPFRRVSSQHRREGNAAAFGLREPMNSGQGLGHDLSFFLPLACDGT